MKCLKFCKSSELTYGCGNSDLIGNTGLISNYYFSRSLQRMTDDVIMEAILLILEIDFFLSSTFYSRITSIFTFGLIGKSR